MCSLKQLCASPHGGRGGKINGLGFREPCSHFEICTFAVTLLVGMGRRTEWQASWGEVVDSNGDKYGECLVKLDEEDVNCR